VSDVGVDCHQDRLGVAAQVGPDQLVLGGKQPVDGGLAQPGGGDQLVHADLVHSGA
jgi:hypothetical protein